MTNEERHPMITGAEQPISAKPCCAAGENDERGEKNVGNKMTEEATASSFLGSCEKAAPNDDSDSDDDANDAALASALKVAAAIAAVLNDTDERVGDNADNAATPNAADCSNGEGSDVVLTSAQNADAVPLIITQAGQNRNVNEPQNESEEKKEDSLSLGEKDSGAGFGRGSRPNRCGSDCSEVSENSLTLDAVLATRVSNRMSKSPAKSTRLNQQQSNSTSSVVVASTEDNRQNKLNSSRPSLRSRPGLVRQRTARNVLDAKTTTFVETPGMKQAAQFEEQQQHAHHHKQPPTMEDSDQSLRAGGGIGRDGNGGDGVTSCAGSTVQRTSFVSSCGFSDSQFSLGYNIDEDEDDKGQLEIDLCDECLHCPSLTALRHSFVKCMKKAGGNPCSQMDEKTGRLPLHCIGLNRDLILLCAGDGGASIDRLDDFILKELLPAHPSAIINEDDEGQLPFTEIIIKWVTARRAVRSWRAKQHRNRKKKKDNHDRDKLGNNKNDNNLSEDVLENIREVCGGGEHDEDEDDEIHDLPPLVQWSLRILSAIVDQPPNQLGSSRFGEGDSSGKRRGGINRREGMRGSNKASVNMVHDDILVEKIALIPHLIEELLLIEDKAARAQVFDLSIVHKILFTNESLRDGKWLVNMLNKGIHEGAQVNVHMGTGGRHLNRRGSMRNSMSSLTRQNSLHSIGSTVDALSWRHRMDSRASLQGSGKSISSNEDQLNEATKVVGALDINDGYKHAEAGVFYLEQISNLNILDDLHVLHHLQMLNGRSKGNASEMIGGSDLRHFRRKRDALYDTIGGICGLIRILCVLEGDLVTRATVTPVVQRALDKRIFSPFAMTIAVIDGIIHFLLILSFRLGPSPAMFHLNPDDTEFRPFQYLFSNLLLFTCIMHFFVKEVQLSYAKYSLSPRLFWSEFFTFWNLIDIVPLACVAFCSIAVDMHLRSRALDPESHTGEIPFYLRVAVATTTPFLWLRVLGHLKMWNKQLATFILCSVEIMKDIKWFMLVLLIAMSSFAQMFVSLTFEPEDMASEESGEYHYFSLEGYLKAYTIMLGDFDSPSLKQHTSITVLFILYTFGVTIVLLNILIAIVSESYATSTTTSKTMLGKARIMFVSELSSLHQFFRKSLSGEYPELTRAQRNMDVASFAVSSLVALLFVNTLKAKLIRSGAASSWWLLHSPHTYWFDLKAFLVFGFFCALKLFVNLVTAHIQQNFRYSGSVKQKPIEVQSAFTQKVNDIIEEIYAYVSSGVDFLTDEDDNKVLADSANKGDSDENTQMNQTETQFAQLKRAIQGNKREMKSEIKQVTENLRHSLSESEHNQHDKMYALEERIQAAVNSTRMEIATMIESSEDRMIRAITAALSAPNKTQLESSQHFRDKLGLYRPEREEDDEGQWSDYD